MYGVVEGPGTLSQDMTNTTMAKCAKKCNSLSTCLFFEWVPANNSCNLNKERRPSIKPVMGFMFCSKLDYGKGTFNQIVCLLQ